MLSVVRGFHNCRVFGLKQGISTLRQLISKIVRSHPGKSVLILAVLVALGIVLTRPVQEQVPRREKVWIVNVVPVETMSIRPTLQLFGSVLSPQDTQLSAAIEANVVEVLAQDGETVTDGQVLVRLDNRDAELSLQQQAANLLEIEARHTIAKRRLDFTREALEKEKELFALAESRLVRSQELFDLKRLSKSDFENVSENFKRQQIALNDSELNVLEGSTNVQELEAQIMRAQALVEQANLTFERAEIVAPFDGVVSESQISVGDRVRIGDTLLRIQNPKRIEIRAQVPSRYAKSLGAALARGDVMAASVSFEDENIAAELLRVSALTRENSGGVDAYVGIKGDPQGLRIGSTVSVLLELAEEDNVFTVPAEAVYGQDRVYILDGDRMKMQRIERVGERSLEDGRTQALLRSSSLTSENKIIVTKLANPRDGLRVDVYTEEPKSTGQSDDQDEKSAPK